MSRHESASIRKSSVTSEVSSFKASLRFASNDVSGRSSTTSAATVQSERSRRSKQESRVSSAPSLPTASPSQSHIVQLPRLTALTAASVLEDCLDEILVIGRSCNSQDASSTKCSSLHDKYAGERSTRVYDPQTLRSYENAEAELEEVKHRIDRRFLNALLEETSRGLRTYGSFDEVERRLKLVVREKGDEEELLVSVEGKNGRLVELKGLLDDRSKDEDVRDVKVAEDRLSQLRNAYEERLVICGVEIKYVKKWELARFESCKYAHDLSEETYSKNIQVYKTEIERENRINEEIAKYLREEQQDAEQQMLDWMERYESEVDERDTELMILREKRENQVEKMEAVKKLFEEHKAAIEAYVVVRNKRMEAEARLELMEEAALKIQNWWRRVMFVRKLGPYRKKKGKGKNKKKKK